MKEDKREEQLNSLQDIKTLMERSSRFSALSGASSICAGVIAILGCLYVAFQLDFPVYAQAKNIMHWNDTAGEKITLKFLIMMGGIISFLAFAVFLVIANLRAKKHNVKLLNSTGRKFFFNHLVFLLSGGLFAVILFYYGFYLLIVPSLLIFYGLALINISKFSFDTIRNFGILEVVLGFALCLMPVYAFLFFFIGFGVLHIVYGLILHFNYDRISE